MPVKIAHRDKKAVAELLADWSERGGVTGPAYFKQLITQAGFPKGIALPWFGAFKGDPSYDAWRLIEFAETIGTNPQDRNAALGSILLPLLPGAGLEDKMFLANVIVAYGLVSSAQIGDELRSKYQIPTASVVAAKVVDGNGPTVGWAPETMQSELQGWFAPDPVWVDVAMMMNATDRARSVCRVEMANGNRGTGLLVGRDLVLTNYHVLAMGLDAPLETLVTNAKQVTLRFGAFRSVGPAAAGQEVRLDPQTPVATASAAHDFVLMRTDESIDNAADIQPYATLANTPAKTDPLYVLQHPEGGPMMVALGRTGVTWVDPQGITVQYTTKVAGGSSGSPCFDNEWKLVALHSRGSTYKGVGMLLASIFEQVKPFLKS
jgi:V8-like Glu-specific endopeptidase